MAALMRFDETLGEPLSNARHSGYHRLSAGDTVVISDTGCPPQCRAVACGPCRNAGVRTVVPDGAHRRQLRRAAARPSRTGAARALQRGAFDGHPGGSVVVALCRPATARSLSRLSPRARPDGGARRRDSPRRPASARSASSATHDGYERDFGFLHARRLTLSAEGDRLEGTDRLVPTRQAAGARGCLSRQQSGFTFIRRSVSRPSARPHGCPCADRFGAFAPTTPSRWRIRSSLLTIPGRDAHFSSSSPSIPD